MRRALFVLIALLFVCGNAHAARLVSALGDQNSSKNSRIQIDDGGTVTFAKDTSIVYPYRVASASVTTDTVTALHSGLTIFSPGTSAGNDFVLPRAAGGLVFKFVSQAAKTITVDTVDSSDTINYTGLTAGYGIKSAGAAGDSIVICGSGTANTWDICEMKGTWTAVAH